tara:strand:+ start:2451 stop:2690 length:240 start_codon:yes stop_codon:yes gene_type:complete
MYTFLCKIIKNDNIPVQRTGVVLTPNDELPAYINWHKNYAKACGLKPGHIYAVTVSKEQQDNGYDKFNIKQKLDLGKMS